MQRRLSAILAIDVVGYSRLMEKDETDTLARLNAARNDIIDPKVAAYNGRVVKLIGDGSLIEFASVTDAVGCAVEIQRTMGESNAQLSGGEHLKFRVGINLGDVIADGDDIYGDGVNVAARLEGLADPGGILISGAAFDQVERNLDYPFEFLGEKPLKNIERPVRLYSVHLGTKSSSLPGKRRPVWQLAAVLAVVVAALAAGLTYWTGWLQVSVPPIEVASKARMAQPLPDKPSIAVLAFTNMSDAPGQQFFADGMTDSLITDLSKVSGLFVISRNSSFVYENKPVKISQVAEDLGVRYVLEGSVQRAGDQLRVNAQLIDALTGGHVWADRFDGDISNIFAVQDAFVSKIVDALKVKLTTTEKQAMARGKTQSVSAKQAFDEGSSYFLRYTPDGTVKAIAAFKKAIEIDPTYGRAYAALSLAYFRIIYSYWYKELSINAFEAWYASNRHLKDAEQYPTALSHAVHAYLAANKGFSDEARKEAGLAIAQDPNDPETHMAMALALTISGKPDEALQFVATALRLNPNYPAHYALIWGTTLFAAGRLEQAAEVLQEGVKRYPQGKTWYMPLSSVLARLGRREEARQVLLKWLPGLSSQELENYFTTFLFPYKWDDQHKIVRERLYDGVRVAALPPDVTVASLEAALNTDDPFQQIFAAQRLGWFGPAASEAVPALIKALGNEYVRSEAVQSLGKIGPKAKAALPALTAMEDEPVIGAYAKKAIKEIATN